MRSTFKEWIDKRFPVIEFWRHHASHYLVPKNFNFWYYFGSLALVVLILQILTGIWLTFYYTPTAESAFASVEMIMRDVRFGWLIRYLHSTGASAFFIVIYCHMFRGLLYGSYQSPRELVWLIGMVIYVVLLAEAFMGYLLPWGQMSYWGAEVITSLFGAIPGIGESLLIWLRGDYAVSGVTLHRFFALHVAAVPLALLFLAVLHITALHRVGSSNPDGIEVKQQDTVPFHPYYTVKDMFGLGVFLFLFSAILFFAPEMGGYFLEPENFVPANPMQTPPEISPVWYMTPFYAMLRAVPNKLLGIAVLLSAIVILFALPWLDRSPVRSMRYRGLLSKSALGLFTVSFMGLAYLGTMPVSDLRNGVARILTLFYFSFFLGMPFYTRYERTKALPERVTS